MGRLLIIFNSIQYLTQGNKRLNQTIEAKERITEKEIQSWQNLSVEQTKAQLLIIFKAGIATTSSLHKTHCNKPTFNPNNPHKYH